MAEKPKSAQSSSVNGEHLKDQYIQTPLYQKKLRKNISGKGAGPRITWKGKGKGRKKKEMMAYRRNRQGKGQGKEEEVLTQDKEEDVLTQEEGEDMLTEEEAVDVMPIAAKKYKYVRACIEHKLKKKRDKREARMREEVGKMKEEMARREARQPFPTLDMSAEVCWPCRTEALLWIPFRN